MVPFIRKRLKGKFYLQWKWRFALKAWHIYLQKLSLIILISLVSLSRHRSELMRFCCSSLMNVWSALWLTDGCCLIYVPYNVYSGCYIIYYASSFYRTEPNLVVQSIFGREELGEHPVALTIATPAIVLQKL